MGSYCENVLPSLIELTVNKTVKACDNKMNMIQQFNNNVVKQNQVLINQNKEYEARILELHNKMEDYNYKFSESRKQSDAVLRKIRDLTQKYETMQSANVKSATLGIDSVPYSPISRPLSKNVLDEPRVQFNLQASPTDKLSSSNVLNETCSNLNRPNIKFTPPKFSGESREKPTKYLKTLKRYITATNVDFDQIIYIITEGLSGKAATWFEAIESKIRSFDDFEREFRQRFWSRDVQVEWSRKIEYGRYDPEWKTSRLDYASGLWGFSQELDCKYSESDLVKKIGEHFDWDIRYAIRSQSITTQHKIFELLEYKDKNDSSRNNAKNYKPSETHERVDNSRSKWNDQTTSRNFEKKGGNGSPPQKTFYKKPFDNQNYRPKESRPYEKQFERQEEAKRLGGPFDPKDLKNQPQNKGTIPKWINLMDKISETDTSEGAHGISKNGLELYPAKN